MSVLDTTLIRILIIDSHAIVRSALRLLLDGTPGFQVVGDTGSIAEAIALAHRQNPDIIIFEAASEIIEPAGQHSGSSNGLPHQFAPTSVERAGAPATAPSFASREAQAAHANPDFQASPLFEFLSAAQQSEGIVTDGVDFMPALFEAAPDVQIVVLTGSQDSQLHRRVVAQGAKGLLQKDCAPEVLKRAIECVYNGEVWIERTMMASVLAEIAQTGSAAFSTTPNPATLTKREREVISLLCEGLPNRQIAARLCISETTVRRHLTTIFAKLGVSDRLELVIYAYRHGLAGPLD
jgi:DNA-binding NarL/FixJ family response regulator